MPARGWLSARLAVTHPTAAADPERYRFCSMRMTTRACSAISLDGSRGKAASCIVICSCMQLLSCSCCVARRMKVDFVTVYVILRDNVFMYVGLANIFCNVSCENC